MEETNKAIIETLNKGLEGVNDQLTKQAKKYEDRIEELQSKMNEQAKNAGEVEQSLKDALTAAEKNYTSLKERQDAYETSAGRLGKSGGESFASALTKSLTDNAAKLKEYRTNRNPVNLELDVKAAITMTQGDSLEGEVIEPTRIQGVRFDPERRVRVRQFLPSGTTSSNQVSFTQETDYEDGVNITDEGAEKPLSSFKLEQKYAPVVKIATHFKVSEEMIEDIPYLASHISLRGVQKYANKEDQQLLYGTGLGGQIEGLTVSSTAYQLNQYTGDANAQEYDILLEAHKQLLNQNYMATANLISITRYFDLLRRKDSQGRYILPPGITFDNGVLRVVGTPIVPTNALANDDFLVSDFPQLTTLFDRKGVNVRFYDQNEDDAIKNLVTVVIEGRLALPTYLPNAGRFGNFANAITNAGNS